MSGWCNLLPVGEILELPLHRCEIGVVLLPDRGSHRMNKNPVTVGDRCDDAGSDVVLRRKNTRCPEVPIIGLGPELRSRLGVDKLSADTNAGASLADTTLQNIARAEFRTQSSLVSSLSLQSLCRCAGNDRQIAKPRKPGGDFLAETIGERLHLRVTRALERKYRDPQLFAARGNWRCGSPFGLPQLLRHLRI